MAITEGYTKMLVSALLGAAFGVSLAYSTGVASNRTEIVRLATKVEALTETIRSSMTDRYRGADAIRDFSAITQRISTVEGNVKELHQEMQDHIRSHNGKQAN